MDRVGLGKATKIEDSDHVYELTDPLWRIEN